MSYERQRNVEDGQEVIARNDLDDRCVTKGPLVHGVDPNQTATPITINDQKELNVNSVEVIHLLQKILKELKKMNVYNAMSHDMEIDNDEIDGE